MQEQKAIDWCKRHYKIIAFQIIMGLILYFLMMSHDLANDLDGIWHTSNFVAGKWEISLGRWMIRYFEKMRFGVVSAPFNVFLTISIFSVANAFLTDLFELHGKPMAYLLGFVVIASPVMCLILSYLYLSVDFAMAYLMAIIAGVLLCRGKRIVSAALSALCLALSLATYQAYLGVTCIVILIYHMKLLLDTDKGILSVRDIVRIAAGFIAGGGLYVVSIYAMLQYAGTALSSYRGASGLSLSGILMSLPGSVLNCYSDFFSFFCQEKMYLLTSERVPLTEMLLLLAAAILISNIIYLAHADRKRAVLFLLFGILIPIACNAVSLCAPGNHISMAMSVPMVLCIALICLLFPARMKPMNLWVKRYAYAMLALLIWLGAVTVSNDQLALDDGKNATVTLLENIITDLRTAGYLTDDKTVALVGRAAENDSFLSSEAYQLANSYAQFGKWSTSVENHYMTLNGILYHYCQTSLPLCSAEEYEELRTWPEVAEMPDFPAEGSIIERDGIVIVKLSEMY